MGSSVDIRESIDPFVRSYIETAIWSEAIDRNGGNEHDGEYIDSQYTIEDIDSRLFETMKEDCECFLSLDGVRDILSSLDKGENNEVWRRAGHDFWLTRNGHGAGFWSEPDFYGQNNADKLTAIASKFNECHLAVHNNKIFEV